MSAALRLQVAADAAGTARAAAEFIAEQARTAVAARGAFSLALSGGRSPRAMFAVLAAMDLPWSSIQLFQVDERIAPAGDSDRNWTSLQELLARASALPSANAHPMPVEAPDGEAAAAEYARALRAVCGDPPVLDLAQLGLGGDGHTASLVPGDAVLAVEDREVALTGRYQGRRRMTLTYPVLRRARVRMWLVTGADKAPALTRLLAADASIPAGRLAAAGDVVFADAAAARR